MRRLHLAWKFIIPFYYLQWTLRPLVAFLWRRREAAKFHRIVGNRKFPDEAAGKLFQGVDVGEGVCVNVGADVKVGVGVYDGVRVGVWVGMV